MLGVCARANVKNKMRICWPRTLSQDSNAVSRFERFLANSYLTSSLGYLFQDCRERLAINGGDVGPARST